MTSTFFKLRADAFAFYRAALAAGHRATVTRSYTRRGWIVFVNNDAALAAEIRAH